MEKKESYSFQKLVKLLVNNEELSDCSFLVGEEKVKFYGHKMALAIASPAFKSMFYGDLKEKDRPIEIPDISPIGFKNMLKYIYGFGIDFKLSESYETFVAGDKYLVSGLNGEIFEYIKSKFNLENCVLIYDQLLRFRDESSMIVEIRKMIKENSKTIFESKNFKKIDEIILIDILKMDCLNINEIDILKSCLNWVNYQIKINDLPSTLENKRKLFEPIKNLIKFSYLKLNELNDFTEIDNLLTLEEVASLFLHLSSNKTKPFMIKCKTPRGFISTIYSVKGEPSFAISGFSNSFRVFLRVNKQVMVTSIQTSLKGDPKKLKLTISDSKKVLITKFKRILDDDGYLTFEFLNNFDLDPNNTYDLEFSFNNCIQTTYYLCNQSKLELNNYGLNILFNIDFNDFHCIQKINFFTN